jgi:hypothetical protein
MRAITTRSNWLDFSPNGVSESTNVWAALILVERAIIEGSGGPDNVPITKVGLRFIRHLLSVLPIDQYANLPNFKNMNTIRRLAMLFIDGSDSPAQALQSMQAIMQAGFYKPGFINTLTDDQQ